MRCSQSNTLEKLSINISASSFTIYEQASQNRPWTYPEPGTTATQIALLLKSHSYILPLLLCTRPEKIEGKKNRKWGKSSEERSRGGKILLFLSMVMNLFSPSFVDPHTGFNIKKKKSLGGIKEGWTVNVRNRGLEMVVLYELEWTGRAWGYMQERPHYQPQP